MYSFILFFISFIFVLSSSYFLAALLKPARSLHGIIYLVLIFVSQIILTIESLSIISQIKPYPLLFINGLVLIGSFLLWKFKKYPVINIQGFSLIRDKILYSLKKDKILLIISIFFIFSCLISLLFTILVPSSNSDSMAYHLARIGFWVQNHTLNHFETSSIRQIIYPINSEILILWSMVFLKRDYLAIFPQYLAFAGCLLLIGGYLSYFKISMRRILWTIFILASLPAIIIESSSTQTNLIVAFFLLCSIYLYIYGIRENDKVSIIFSAVAFSINMGIKYTTFFFIPVLGIVYLLISLKEKQRDFYKPLAVFILASLPAFLLLSSYNYILNYIHFGNIFGLIPYLERFNAILGYKAFLANMIKYFFMFFDFSGLSYLSNLMQPVIFSVMYFIFSIFKLHTSDGLAFIDFRSLNAHIHEGHSLFGLLGFLVLIPLIFKSVFTKAFYKNSKAFYIVIAGLIFLGFIVCMSGLTGFCMWNNRFLVTPVVISSVLLIYTYTKRLSLFKTFIALIVITNYLLITTFNSAKPLMWVMAGLKHFDYSSFRQELRLAEDGVFWQNSGFYYPAKYLSKAAPDNSRIALLYSDDDIYYPFFEENTTWKIYPLRYEMLLKKNNYNDYDFLVFQGDEQYVDILNYNDIKFNYKIQGANIIYNETAYGEPIIIYVNRTGDPVKSGKPIMQGNAFKFQEIPNNFKLLTTLKTKDTYFYIYKKIS